jgi:hypothetical protein
MNEKSHKDEKWYMRQKVLTVKITTCNVKIVLSSKILFQKHAFLMGSILSSTFEWNRPSKIKWQFRIWCSSVVRNSR